MKRSDRYGAVVQCSRIRGNQRNADTSTCRVESESAPDKSAKFRLPSGKSDNVRRLPRTAEENRRTVPCFEAVPFIGGLFEPQLRNGFQNVLSTNSAKKSRAFPDRP